MSRDKCGAADVAGFFKVVDTLKPKNVKVIVSSFVGFVRKRCYEFVVGKKTWRPLTAYLDASIC